MKTMYKETQRGTENPHQEKKKNNKQNQTKNKTPRTDLIHGFLIKEQKDCFKQQKRVKWNTILSCLYADT